MIKEIIFDIDDTMYPYTDYNLIGLKGMHDYIEKHFTVDPEEFLRVYEKIHLETEARLGVNNAAAHSRHIWVQETLEYFDLPLFPHVLDLYESYWGTIVDCIRPEPGLTECVRTLYEMGKTLGIGSDMTTMMQYRKLEGMGLSGYFSHIVTSQEAGFEKPHDRFFEMVIKKARVKPEECLFIGDNIIKDVKGALDHGMAALWFNPKNIENELEKSFPSDRYRRLTHFDQVIPFAEEL